MINVLFLCIGNSCRSQMAEGFARKYGGDVMQPWSAGLAPASIVQPLTIDVMNQKHIDISEQFPKSLDELELNSFDLIINMSGMTLPTPIRERVRNWSVVDPMAQTEDVYLRVRDQIEGLVMQFILELRRQARDGAIKGTTGPVMAGKDAVTPIEAPRRFGFGRLRKARD